MVTLIIYFLYWLLLQFYEDTMNEKLSHPATFGMLIILFIMTAVVDITAAIRDLKGK